MYVVKNSSISANMYLIKVSRTWEKPTILFSKCIEAVKKTFILINEFWEEWMFVVEFSTFFR